METIQKWLGDRRNQPAIYLLLGGLMLRSLIAFWLPIGFDEAYYYTYTLNPRLSYFDHPLMVALSTALGIGVTGGQVTPLTLRLGALVLYTGSLLLLYLIGAQLFSRRVGFLALAIASISPIFLMGFGVLTLPDAPLIFFWAATLFWAVQEFFRRPTYQPSYRIAILGLLLGLTCLSKYHGFVLGFSLVGFCLTSRQHRSALLSPWTLLALGLFCLTIAPLVIWNGQHDWVSLRFQADRGVPRMAFDLLAMLGTSLVGIAYLFPTIGFPLWWSSLRAIGQQLTYLRSAQRQRQQTQLKQRLILWVAMPLILGFTLVSGYQQVLPTWQMPGFWSATLLLGLQAEGWQITFPGRVRNWLWGSGLVVVLVLLLALSHVTLGTLQKPSQNAPFGGFLPISNDASVQLVDILQLRQRFREQPELAHQLEQADFVFSDRFYLTGHIALALNPISRKPYTCFDIDPRGFVFWSKPTDWLGKNALYVTSQQVPNATPDKYQDYFQAIQLMGEVPLYRGGEVIDRMKIYWCQTMVKPYPRPYGL